MSAVVMIACGLLLAAPGVETSSAAVDTGTAAAARAPIATEAIETRPAEPIPATDASPSIELPEEPGTWGAYLRFGSVIAQDPAFDALSELGALARVELGGVYALDPRWSVELGLAYGTPSAMVLGRFELGLSVASIQASLAYRQPLIWHLSAHGRATIGGDLGTLGVADAGTETDLSDGAVGLGGALTAGFSLDLPLTGALVFAEAGYQLHTGFAFDGLSRDTDEDVDPSRIPRGEIDVGGLHLSGVLWRIGATLVF